MSSCCCPRHASLQERYQEPFIHSFIPSVFLLPSILAFFLSHNWISNPHLILAHICPSCCSRYVFFAQCLGPCHFRLYWSSMGPAFGGPKFLVSEFGGNGSDLGLPRKREMLSKRREKSSDACADWGASGLISVLTCCSSSSLAGWLAGLADWLTGSLYADYLSYQYYH